MPLLTRMIGAPLHVDIGPGTVAQLAPLLADRRISAGGHVAVVVGPGLGEEIAETLRPGSRRRLWTLDGGGVAEADALAKRLRAGSTTRSWDRRRPTLDVSKLASTLRACRWSRWPRASPTTASARRSPRWRRSRKGSYGVRAARLVVDLDYVTVRPPPPRYGVAT